MKTGELVVIVDSVEDAVKFYTERLAFDITDLQVDTETQHQLGYAHLKKGKCSIIFRRPNVQEFAEFTFIKRCSSRCVTLLVEMKNGLDKYFAKCSKKDVVVIQEPREVKPGVRSFVVSDPFGVKLMCTQVTAAEKPVDLNVFGVQLQRANLVTRKDAEKLYLEQIAAQLKRFGVLRRASKKYAKLRVKEAVTAVNKK